ncbi:MAG TPA: organic solvent tolerance protein OstA [Fervidobacterium sp.]|nr:organic solvent tolerance protein OstA [Fervidobacterium sp.]HOK87457.1 organic solvent tolerance protein OstA [Fervidobacterium sp.]HOM73688.1 organic solvent tolerance protein OstA [Fervidobacterium sp.]HOQ39489.1 organic solvent tolerance protein OstA [Fervidobacterium sp.]HPT53996.1 organic solvent tolerance protein OstA [Fervidobacterium sp.]
MKSSKVVIWTLLIILLSVVIVFAQTTTTTTTTSAKKSKTVRVSADYVEPKSDVIYYKGKVFVNIDEDKVSVKTTEMYVKKVGDKWRNVEIPVKSEFSFDGGSAVADKMTYDLDNRTGTLVNTTITIIDTKSNEKIIIVADNVNYDLENDKYNGTKKGGVNITKGDITAIGDKFDYDKKKGELILVGAVVINDSKKGIKMTASDAVINTENNDMKANNVNIELKVE